MEPWATFFNCEFKIKQKRKKFVGAGLAPLAVLPECQKKGIGTKLVEAGNARLRELGIPFIVVLGHSTYYPRFGFDVANKHGIKCKWNVEENSFMVLVVDHKVMKNVSGVVKCRPEFHRLI